MLAISLALLRHKDTPLLTLRMSCASCLVADLVTENSASGRRITDQCVSWRFVPLLSLDTPSLTRLQFEDVRHATKALQELHGHTLNGLVKSGGIRLSYSKNPLGVRTPTSATGSSMQQQQPYNFKELHSAPPSSSFFPPESFSRQISQSDHHPRRDTMQSYQYTTPAPRFAASTASSPTATTTHYATSVTQIPSHVSSFPRSIHDSVANSTFAPFRMSAADQFGADLLSSNLHSVNERFGHSLSTPANGIEASRAG